MTTPQENYDALVRAQAAFRQDPTPALASSIKRLQGRHKRNPLLQTWQVEVTDTFAGDANYSWVRRYSLTAPAGSAVRALVRRAKALAGYAGVPASTSDYGDTLDIRPRGVCVAIFVTFVEA